MARRRAWIIGGGSGVGAELAVMLAERDWTVVISGRREDRLAEVARRRAGIFTRQLDVTDRQAVEAAVKGLFEDGGIDLLIYGAAAWHPMDVGDYDFEKFNAVVDTNLLGVVRMVGPVAEAMKRQGGGQIAIIASLAGYLPLPRAAAYGSTKAALIHLTKVMKTELAPHNIQMRLINPGFFKSELTAKNDFPMPFLLETEEAARRIVDGLLESDRFEIAFPRRMALIVALSRLLPNSVFLSIARRMLPKG
ncbi:SDR family NAD(P)-dependent oxidoreductase [Arsenicitalea aurantiaca]|uniref:SDR family NAD(P)-dependent oxidoreductase n=1 Tax=Arsenicitalea aurantiaca TaxID=1783274 RepID=A0A433XEQ8_9HYPH|nr:SDR family NAD(P)-dependent oxidoreductase [Arsenicitalea aurantiaca]RUT32573.1 SDR family NAD(P)-dependent oxidoreductase [Arsenicitalea aurantiaca]